MGNFKKLAQKRLFLPVFSMILVMLINVVYDIATGSAPLSFFMISIKNGVLYGRLIDILNRGSEIAILAIGMTLVVSASGIRAAKERGLLTVQRFFLLDSQSVTMAAETAASVRPDMVEVMPGICPRVIRRLSSAEGRRLPVIAGGMIEEKEDIVEALSAGASGVSTSRTELWEL